MNIILNSLKKTLKLIKKHKSLFIMLLLIQLVFFSVFLTIQFFYWLKIMDSSLEVIDYLSAQDLGEEALEESLLTGANISVSYTHLTLPTTPYV